MYYYIDGYNLIFSLLDTQNNLQTLRKLVVKLLQECFQSLHLSGIVVFDGNHRRDEESGLSYATPLEIAYSPRGQTADLYILEKLQIEPQPHLCVVVTNDLGLKTQALSVKAKVYSNAQFLHFLQNRSPQEKKPTYQDSPYHIERLLKAFEERLEKNEEEDFFS